MNMKQVPAQSPYNMATKARRVVYRAEYPPQGSCKSVTDAPILANNVHEEVVGFVMVRSHRRVRGSLKSRTLEG